MNIIIIRDLVYEEVTLKPGMEWDECHVTWDRARVTWD